MDNQTPISGRARKGNEDINSEITKHMNDKDCSMLFPDAQTAVSFFRELAKKDPETMNYPLPHVIIDKGQASGSYSQVCRGTLDAPKP